MTNPPPQKPFDLAIIGGGITGVILAIALTGRNIRCTVYEQAGAFGEIGAGVGVHPGAARALGHCDPRLLDALERVSTFNAWPDKRRTWFDVLDGTAGTPAPELDALFAVVGEEGEGAAPPARAAHRARFMDGMVGLLPDGVARFGKRLRDVVDDREGSGKMLIRFLDGSVAEADAVLGCDGVKSRTREIVVGGEDKPGAKCGYSYKYAYRGLIPMKDAVEALGSEKAENCALWMGQDRHVLTFPVNHGATLNMVAFVTDKKEWPSDVNLTLPATREEALADFEGFGPNVMKLIGMTEEKQDRWGLFDLVDNPLSTFYKGRVCLVGDSAHASTPHHGAGAGFCIEDVAVLASLLADDAVKGPDDLEAVFAAYDAIRRERDQWLVRSSRRAADVYEWRELGRDFDAIHKDMQERQEYIWGVDMEKQIEEARQDLRKRLGVDL